MPASYLRANMAAVIVALDVGYPASPSGDTGVCAVVGFRTWADTAPTHELVVTISSVEPYVSGRLFERELPCLIAGLDELRRAAGVEPTTVVVDGNVRLDPQGSPGLGMYLWRHLGEQTPVIGVAKAHYVGLDAVEILRGDSAKPLFVTAVGVDEQAAARHIELMAGEFRLPALLKRADQLTR